MEARTGDGPVKLPWWLKRWEGWVLLALTVAWMVLGVVIFAAKLSQCPVDETIQVQ